MSSVHQPVLHFLDRPRRDRYQPLLASLACHLDESFFKIEVRQLQATKLRHPQAAAVEGFYHRPVALAFRLVHVYSSDNGVYLVHRKHLGQFETDFGSLYQFTRIVFAIVGQYQEMEERLEPRQDACLRTWMNADVVQSGNEAFQIIRSDVEYPLFLTFQKAKQLLQVHLIGLIRIFREAFFQPEILLVLPDDQLLPFLIW